MPADPEEKRTRRALGAAWSALDAFAKGEPLGPALSEAMRAEAGLGPKEKRSSAHVARGVVRELRRIDLALNIACDKSGIPWKSIAPNDRTILRYLALRVTIEHETPARVLQELRLPSAPRAFTLGETKLTKLAAALPHAELLPLPDEPLRAMALRRSVPDALAERLAAELGLERADAVLGGLNAPPRWDLRTNRLLINRESLRVRLEKDGVKTRPGPFSPDALIADDRAGLFGRAHDEGLFELQDEGSQLIALACGARTGELAIDYCAGSGGKSLALASDVGRSGSVVACDAVPGRLRDLPERVRRARAGGIVQVGGAVPDGSLRERADVVLVDAPCSGLGSLRREVDLRWRLGEKVLATYPPKQLDILSAAAEFVRPGGRLVYATCSPLRAECEAVVEGFLARDARFALQHAKNTLPESAHAAVENGFLRTWPDRHDTGAFFAAVLVRT